MPRTTHPAPVDRTSGRLDRAIIAHRENPTPATRAALLAVQAEHRLHFHTELTIDYQARTA